MQGRDEEYGAVEDAENSSNKRSMRTYLVTGIICVTMVAALALLASNSQDGPVEDMISKSAESPDEKLERMVHAFAVHGSTMSLAEMEKKLNDWRHETSTILDVNVNHAEVREPRKLTFPEFAESGVYSVSRRNFISSEDAVSCKPDPVRKERRDSG